MPSILFTQRNSGKFSETMEQETKLKAKRFTDIPAKFLQVAIMGFCVFRFKKSALSKHTTFRGFWNYNFSWILEHF